jgi:ribosomal protein S26
MKERGYKMKVKCNNCGKIVGSKESILKRLGIDKTIS